MEDKKDLSKILAISGKGGLYLVVSQSRNGLIVESLLDGRKIPVFATERSSALADISIFGQEEDIPLEEVFSRIHKGTEGKPVEDPQKIQGSEIKIRFGELLPDYDQDRVYLSDMKKVFSWYNLLLEKEIIPLPEKPKDEEGEDASAEDSSES